MSDTKALTDHDLMGFGKYKGTPMKDVPADYLLWIWDEGVWRDEQDWKQPLRLYIRQNLSSLEQDAPDYILKHDPRKK